MASVRKKFDKYACEDIRTDFIAFDGSEYKPADTPVAIPSRTIVEFNSSTKKLAPKDSAQASDIDNKSVFMLAEDYKEEDSGIVVFIIERTANLV